MVCSGAVGGVGDGGVASLLTTVTEQGRIYKLLLVYSFLVDTTLLFASGTLKDIIAKTSEEWSFLYCYNFTPRDKTPNTQKEVLC